MPVLQTKELGSVEFDEQEIITFPEGIPGFEDYHRYVLIQIDKQLPILYMQSVDEPDLRFIIANPFVFKPNYEFKLDDAIKEKLSIDSVDNVSVYSLVTIPDQDFQKATMNLLGPIIVNEKECLAKQTILHGTNYSMKHPLFSSDASPEGSGE